MYPTISISGVHPKMKTNRYHSLDYLGKYDLITIVTHILLSKAEQLLLAYVHRFFQVAQKLGA